MNRRNILAIAATVVGLAVIPVAAQKAHNAGAGAGMHERFFGHMATALNLTDAQKATAEQLFKDTKTQAEPLTAQLKQNHTDMEAAVKANNTGQISALAARQGQLAGQLAELHNKAMATFYAQLTPEQKAKADELHGHMAQMMQHRFSAVARHGRGHQQQQLPEQQQ